MRPSLPNVEPIGRANVGFSPAPGPVDDQQRAKPGTDVPARSRERLGSEEQQQVDAGARCSASARMTAMAMNICRGVTAARAVRARPRARLLVVASARPLGLDPQSLEAFLGLAACQGSTSARDGSGPQPNRRDRGSRRPHPSGTAGLRRTRSPRPRASPPRRASGTARFSA